MKNIATASLQTSGSILKNSRCPPRSQILNVISVFRSTIVFSRKFTPIKKCKRSTGNKIWSKILHRIFFQTHLTSEYNLHRICFLHTLPLKSFYRPKVYKKKQDNYGVKQESVETKEFVQTCASPTNPIFTTTSLRASPWSSPASMSWFGRSSSAMIAGWNARNRTNFLFSELFQPDAV